MRIFSVNYSELYTQSMKQLWATLSLSTWAEQQQVNSLAKGGMTIPLEISANSSMLLSDNLMSQAIMLFTIMSAHQDRREMWEEQLVQPPQWHQSILTCGGESVKSVKKSSFSTFFDIYASLNQRWITYWAKQAVPLGSEGEIGL